MKYKLKDISKGDQVVVDNKINATVEETHKDIKNGIPGIDYTTDENKKGFCYLEQITGLTKKPQVSTPKKAEETIYRPQMKDLSDGDTVMVSLAGGRTRVGIIKQVIPEIKNGEDGISFDTETEGSCWCYINQIEKVVKKASAKKNQKKM